MSTINHLPDVAGSASEWECFTKETLHPFAITFVMGGRRAVIPYHDLKNVIGTDSAIRLEFHSRKVEIDGDGLLELLELIAEHKVRRVKRTGRVLDIAILEYRDEDEE